MEGSQKCDYDYLEVYNGETRESANQVAKLCGDVLPDPIISSGPQVFLRFYSDLTFAFKGFKLQFKKTGMAWFAQGFGRDSFEQNLFKNPDTELNATEIVDKFVAEVLVNISRLPFFSEEFRNTANILFSVTFPLR